MYKAQQLAPLNPDIFFSIIIPAYNEEASVSDTINAIIDYFNKKKVSDYEIVVINDNSTDNTEEVLKELCRNNTCLRYINNAPPHGFGFALRKGIESFVGQSVCIVMADLSDLVEDIYKYYCLLKEGHECVFGSRFMRGGQVIDYPTIKLVLNRLANWFIKVLFWIDYNDTTNAFKAYRREVIEGLLPIISCHFNLTVELPLKAIVRGYVYKKIPIIWTNRKKGKSKLVIEEMGSRYLFIVLYVWLEKLLSKGDYRRKMKV